MDKLLLKFGSSFEDFNKEDIGCVFGEFVEPRCERIEVVFDLYWVRQSTLKLTTWSLVCGGQKSIRQERSPLFSKQKTKASLFRNLTVLDLEELAVHWVVSNPI